MSNPETVRARNIYSEHVTCPLKNTDIICSDNCAWYDKEYKECIMIGISRSLRNISRHILVK